MAIRLCPYTKCFEPRNGVSTIKAYFNYPIEPTTFTPDRVTILAFDKNGNPVSGFAITDTSVDQNNRTIGVINLNPPLNQFPGSVTFRVAFKNGITDIDGNSLIVNPQQQDGSGAWQESRVHTGNQNGDNWVDILDWGTEVARFGHRLIDYPDELRYPLNYFSHPRLDLNANGVIDSEDMSLVQQNFLSSLAPITALPARDFGATPVIVFSPEGRDQAGVQTCSSPSGYFYIKEGDRLPVVITASDPEDGILIPVVDQGTLPEGATFAAGNFDWTPGSGQGRSDSYIVRFTATDSSGLETIKNAIIFVAAKPTTELPSNLAVEPTSAYSAKVTWNPPAHSDGVTLSQYEMKIEHTWNDVTKTVASTDAGWPFPLPTPVDDPTKVQGVFIKDLPSYGKLTFFLRVIGHLESEQIESEWASVVVEELMPNSPPVVKKFEISKNGTVVFEATPEQLTQDGDLVLTGVPPFSVDDVFTIAELKSKDDPVMNSFVDPAIEVATGRVAEIRLDFLPNGVDEGVKQTYTPEIDESDLFSTSLKSSGSFTAVLKLIDEGGLEKHIFVPIVVVRNAESPKITLQALDPKTEGPLDLTVPMEAPAQVLFEVSVESPTPTTKIMWDFDGDGWIDATSPIGRTPVKMLHTYPEPGLVNVPQVSVTNKSGYTDWASLKIATAGDASFPFQLTSDVQAVTADQPANFSIEGQFGNYELDLDADGHFEMSDLNNPSPVQKIYGRPGTFYATARVTVNGIQYRKSILVLSMAPAKSIFDILYVSEYFSDAGSDLVIKENIFPFAVRLKDSAKAISSLAEPADDAQISEIRFHVSGADVNSVFTYTTTEDYHTINSRFFKFLFEQPGTYYILKTVRNNKGLEASSVFVVNQENPISSVYVVTPSERQHALGDAIKATAFASAPAGRTIDAVRIFVQATSGGPVTELEATASEQPNVYDAILDMETLIQQRAVGENQFCYIWAQALLDNNELYPQTPVKNTFGATREPAPPARILMNTGGIMITRMLEVTAYQRGGPRALLDQSNFGGRNSLKAQAQHKSSDILRLLEGQEMMLPPISNPLTDAQLQIPDSSGFPELAIEGENVGSLGIFLEANLNGENGTVEELRANTPIKFVWPDTDNDGFVDGTRIPENTLRVYRLVGSAWVLVPYLPDNDETNNGLYFQTNHFSIFTIGGVPTPVTPTTITPEPTPESTPTPEPSPEPTPEPEAEVQNEDQIILGGGSGLIANGEETDQQIAENNSIAPAAETTASSDGKGNPFMVYHKGIYDKQSGGKVLAIVNWTDSKTTETSHQNQPLEIINEKSQEVHSPIQTTK
ncbi:MAG: hypothetical protein HY582_03895, partial [Candidatus Omnitrophica bacterium]|nr:hypothetical protein [Candidatus Omnitrophota bacterium]